MINNDNKKFWKRSDTVKLIVLVVLVSLFIALLVYVAKAADVNKERIDDNPYDLPLTFTVPEKDKLDVPSSGTKASSYNYFYLYSPTVQAGANQGYYPVGSVYVTVKNTTTNANNYWRLAFDYGSSWKNYLYSCPYTQGTRQELNGALTFKYQEDGTYPSPWSNSECYYYLGVQSGYTSYALCDTYYYNGSTYSSMTRAGCYYSTDGTTWNLCTLSTNYLDIIDNGGASFCYVYTINNTPGGQNYVILRTAYGTINGSEAPYYFYYPPNQETLIPSSLAPDLSGVTLVGSQTITFNGWTTDDPEGSLPNNQVEFVEYVLPSDNGKTLWAHFNFGGSATSYGGSYTLIGSRSGSAIYGETLPITYGYQYDLNADGYFLSYNELYSYEYTINGTVVTPTYFSYDLEGHNPVPDGTYIKGNIDIYWQYLVRPTVQTQDPTVVDFASLVGVVVTAPFQWLQVLNFDIYGVNILATIISLLTVVLVIWLIVKLISSLHR